MIRAGTVIAQEASSNDVLMFAWMNRDALSKTVEIGEAVYWSRSRVKSYGIRARSPVMCRK
jgi:phosphoribosyl-AMP cyclohydrolase